MKQVHCINYSVCDCCREGSLHRTYKMFYIYLYMNPVWQTFLFRAHLSAAQYSLFMEPVGVFFLFLQNKKTPHQTYDRLQIKPLLHNLLIAGLLWLSSLYKRYGRYGRSLWQWRFVVMLCANHNQESWQQLAANSKKNKSKNVCKLGWQRVVRELLILRAKNKIKTKQGG